MGVFEQTIAQKRRKKKGQFMNLCNGYTYLSYFLLITPFYKKYKIFTPGEQGRSPLDALFTMTTNFESMKQKSGEMRVFIKQ